MLRFLTLILLSIASVTGTEQGAGGWAFKAPENHEVPAIRNSRWGRNPVDAFILARLQQEGFKPSKEADRRTLIRRLYIGLHGLPPTLEEITAFENDRSPEAYTKLVNRLLDSPRFGEKFGRYWLDTVHFAETHGYDKDKARRNAWPYRDYVIRSFNEDKPFWKFVQEQIAGDVLFPDDPWATVALGFLAAGPWDYVGHVELPESKKDGLIARYNDRDDMVMTSMATFQSLTVHCARCHDHKFDPISQKEYYQLQAVFAGVDRADTEIYLGGRTSKVYRATAKFKPEGSFKPSGAPRKVHFLRRGEVNLPRDEMEPGALKALQAMPSELSGDFKIEGERRAALARWLASKDNFLTRRSIVNRVWQFHFGKGLAPTLNDFGKMGELPSHPELLDWLTIWFEQNGESLKALHKLLLATSTYRQSSGNNATYAKADKDNRLLWRMNRSRLDAEAIRDSILLVSGDLDLTMGGKSDEHFKFKDDHSPVYDYAGWEPKPPFRRSIYRFTVRSVPDPLFDTFDCPDSSVLAPTRTATIGPLQALALMNDKLILRQAEVMAARVAGMQPHEQTIVLVRQILSRTPTRDEARLFTKFVKDHGAANLARTLFNSNEFIMVD